MITTAYTTNTHGDPVVTLTVEGTHDLSRLVNLLRGAPVTIEYMAVGDQLVKKLRRQPGGIAALQLLNQHGGPDLLRIQATERREPVYDLGISFDKDAERQLAIRNRTCHALLEADEEQFVDRLTAWLKIFIPATNLAAAGTALMAAARVMFYNEDYTRHDPGMWRVYLGIVGQQLHDAATEDGAEVTA